MNSKQSNPKFQSKPSQKQQLYIKDEEGNLVPFIPRKFRNQNKQPSVKDETVPKKSDSRVKLADLDSILLEKSIFSAQSQPQEKTCYINQRIIAHDNYSDLMLAHAAVAEYKRIIEIIGPKKKAFSDAWSLPEHVFMRRLMLQQYLALQPELEQLHQIPALQNVKYRFDQVKTDLEQLSCTKEFLKVFLNYLPSQDSNGNVQMFLPYTWRDGNGNAIGHMNQGVYDLNYNLGLTRPVCFTRNQGSYNWLDHHIPDDALVRRYDPMSTIQFMYHQSFGNHQLQGGPPILGHVSYQPPMFNTSEFNSLFGTQVSFPGINYQRTTNSADYFSEQPLFNGILFNSFTKRWNYVLQSFSELKKFLLGLSFDRGGNIISRHCPFRPIIWSQNPGGQESLTFTVQGGATHHILSPFVFWNLHDARGWGGFLIHVGGQTVGNGDFNFFNSFEVGTRQYKDLERADLVKGLELVFSGKVDDVISPSLPKEF